ncbi:MAG: monooxygenase [Propionibacteriales bacterium]|nr:monooxygenase [Propionibacteriales bacterium]
MSRIRRLALALAAAILGGLALAPTPAYAHGEETQQAFVRTSTVILYDVEFSTTSMNVGDPLVIRGKLRVMNSWPDHTVAQPETGFLSIVAPGPKFLVKKRRLNGVSTPQSVRIEKGATYDFMIRAVAKDEGRWHVHPSFSVHDVGTLVGVGRWIDVGPGEVTNPATLARSDERVDLLTFGLDRVVTWHLLGAGLVLAYMLYWLRRSVIARNALVEDGRGQSLIKRRDLVTGGVFAVLAIALLAGGYLVTRATLPEQLLPLQVARLAPPASEAPPALVESEIDRAVWDDAADELRFTVTTENETGSAVHLATMQVGEIEFGRAMRVRGDSVARPVEQTTFTVAVAGRFLREHNLLPLAEPQVRITGLLFFEDRQGREQVTEVDEVTSPVLPGGQDLG